MSSGSTVKPPKLTDFFPEEITPAVLLLLEICRQQHEHIQKLRDEIARLKGQDPKPKIRPSALETEKKNRKKPARKGKRKKTCELEIHETVDIAPEDIPPGSRFKGHEEFTVQDIRIELHNTRFRLQCWESPAGKRLVGQLPPELGGCHFGVILRSFILYQYYHAHVTQPLILEQVREWGVDISAGKLNSIITEGKEAFHEEKDALLKVGLERSSYVHVDDTGARHQGKNGFCTHIGNEQFAWFSSTQSKSRVNFLELLRAGRGDYVVSDNALGYMDQQKLPKAEMAKLAARQGKVSNTQEEWEAVLEELGITAKRHIRIATAGALLGSVVANGVNPELVIISDDAGQFNVLRHALCWIHAERVFAKLLCLGDLHRTALAQVRSAIWELYAGLKAYQAAPSEQRKADLARQFDDLGAMKTCFVSSNKALVRMMNNKEELLVVLDRPEIPLHNNLSERDIREYVKKRKISGSTRSDEGRRCRDTFTSLKKTCRKNGISFWHYLLDRLRGTDRIAPLASWVFESGAPDQS